MNHYRTLTLTTALALTALPAHAQSILCDDSIRTRVAALPDMFTEHENIRIHNDILIYSSSGIDFETSVWSRTAPNTWDFALSSPYARSYQFNDDLLLIRESDPFGPDSQLRLYDVSDPENIQDLGLVIHITEFFPYADVLIDDMLILTPADQLARFYDISDPAAPTILGEVGIPVLRSEPKFAASDTHLYIATETGLAVVDFTNPANPQLINELSSDPFDDAILVGTDNDTLVMSQYGSILIFSLSDPSTPQQISSIPAPHFSTPFRFPSFEPESHRFSVSVGSNIFVYDIADPRSPLLVGTKDIGTTPSELSIHSGSVASLSELGGFVEPLGSITPEGFQHTELFPTNSRHEAVAIDDTTVYIITDTNNGSRLRVFDAADPDNPAQLDTLAINTDIFDLHNQGSALFAASNNGYRAFDITDPTTITEIGTLDEFGYTNAIYVDNQTAYILNPDTQTVSALDISDPANPSVISDVQYTYTGDTPLGSIDLDKLDDTLVVRVSDFIFGTTAVLIDVADPMSMNVTNTFLRYAYFDSDDTYIYSHSSNRFEIRLRANGLDSTRITDIRLDGFQGPPVAVHRVDDRVLVLFPESYYVGSNEFDQQDPGFAVVDISDPATPFQTGHVTLPSTIESNETIATSPSTLALIANTNADNRSPVLIFPLDTQCRACAADFNADSTTSPDDITAFLGAIANQHPSADLNDDGQTDYYDINAFLRIYTNQCPG